MRNLTKVIHKTTVLKDISLSLEKGKIYGLRGVNGSGKTMLMRAICGLIIPTTGCVLVDGKILGKDISFPPSVGLLIESPAFLPGYTGLENLKLIASLKNTATEDEIAEMMRAVRLDPFDRRTYRKYSLGMKQKLGIACALMENPELILLDEPFNALDDSSAEAVKCLVRQQKKKGALIVLACHELTLLENLSDEIIFIEEGQITHIQKSKQPQETSIPVFEQQGEVFKTRVTLTE